MKRRRSNPIFFKAVVIVCAVLGLIAGAAPVVAEAPKAAPDWLKSTTGSGIPVSALDNEQVVPAVAYNSVHDEYLVVWQNNWPGNKDIYATRVSANGQVINWFAVTYGANDRIQPAVAYDPDLDRYLVVWSFDYYGDASDYDIVGRFFPWDGPDPSLSEFSICSYSTSSQFEPKVAFGLAQQEFMVVWTDSTSSGFEISYSRINADGSGTPTGPTPLTSGTLDRIKPDIAYNLARNEYLVTWALLSSSFDIWAVRLRGDGVALGGGEFIVANTSNHEERPAVAACRLADAYLLLYQVLASGDYDIYGRVINGDGTIDPVQWLVSIKIDDDETMPRVACDATGRGFLSVWQHAHAGLKDTLEVWLYDRTGSLNDGYTIATSSSPDELTAPAAAGGVNASFVSFEADRSGTSYQDIHGVLVNYLEVFADGFESGTTNRWSSIVP